MAHVMLYSTSQDGALYMFVTDHAVGAGCANQRDDVLLVQFFLAALAADPLRAGTQRFNYQSAEGLPYDYLLGDRPPLAIDGVCGANTVAYIRHFQKEGSKAFPASDPLSMNIDGVITPVRKGVPWGERTGKVLSIVRLNREYRAIYGAQRLMRIDQDPLFPRELASSFFMA